MLSDSEWVTLNRKIMLTDCEAQVLHCVFAMQDNHRGQIATHMRNAGLESDDVDFSHAARHGLV